MKKKIEIKAKVGGKLEAAWESGYMDYLIYGRVRDVTMGLYREAYEAEVLPQILEHIKARKEA